MIDLMSWTANTQTSLNQQSFPALSHWAMGQTSAFPGDAGKSGRFGEEEARIKNVVHFNAKYARCS